MADGRLKRDGDCAECRTQVCYERSAFAGKMGSRKRAFPSWAGIGILEGHSSGTA